MSFKAKAAAPVKSGSPEVVVGSSVGIGFGGVVPPSLVTVGAPVVVDFVAPQETKNKTQRVEEIKKVSFRIHTTLAINSTERQANPIFRGAKFASPVPNCRWGEFQLEKDPPVQAFRKRRAWGGGS
ncbi:hypothetical protein EBT16_07420 [bacterium]|nr:hypothetical protein [bacterium]